MTNTNPTRVCLFSGRDETQTPLVALHYQGEIWYISPQYLPLLIHDPQRLIGKLPGAEKLQPADHHD